MNKIILLLFVSTLFFACKKEEGCTDPLAFNYNSEAEKEDGSCEYPDPFTTTAHTIITPNGFPDMIHPSDNSLTEEGIALGEYLFNSPILSYSEGLACTSCHLQENGFSSPGTFSSNVNGVATPRNAMALINLGWVNDLAWDGRSTGLEAKVLGSITNPFSVNGTTDSLQVRAEKDAEFMALFSAAFNNKSITIENAAKGLSQYIRTLVSANSKFDKYLKGEVQLSASELGGYATFNSEKGDCFHCHGTQQFADNLFHNNGLDPEPFTNLGLGAITGNAADYGKYRATTLRNIEHTAPYMHDGRFATLEEVVEHYNLGGTYSSTIDPKMKKVGIGLQLTNQEKQDLVAFLKTLTDTYFVGSN